MENKVNPHLGESWEDFKVRTMTSEEITLLHRRVDYSNRREALRLEWRRRQSEPCYEAVNAPHVPQPVTEEN
ncbi:MAG: hypothetical protein LBN97_00875 [Oscillospiraceae bacterium]|jgi:hypothetical protein|nr:hypothetical protein [Oscillospiraceae bacterium]